jgi:branched-chain amino acid transport system ATP-binding protein
LSTLVFEAVSGLPEQGVAVLLVEQMAGRAVELADRSYVMRSGELVASGTSGDVREALLAESAFLGGART